MLDVFKGGKVAESADAAAEKPAPKRSAVASAEGDITFAYCTEYIVMKAAGCGDALGLRAYLESIGDSAVVVDDEDIIKVPCPHRPPRPGNPGRPSNTGRSPTLRSTTCGIQHDVKKQVRRGGRAGAATPVMARWSPDDPLRLCGGGGRGGPAGSSSLDLGVNQVVTGGQTMNPSTDDILRAVRGRRPAHTVFVLPNNKNIIMAAEQAARARPEPAGSASSADPHHPPGHHRHAGLRRGPGAVRGQPPRDDQVAGDGAAPGR